MNLAQLINRFYQDYGEANTNKFSIDLLKEWFDEAERVLNKRTKSIKTRNETTTAVSNQRVYSYPTDVLDECIDNIYYGIDPNNTDRPPLIRSSLEQIKALDPYFLTRTGLPTHWYPDEFKGKYCLYPYEASLSGGANKIYIDYRQKHTKMTRYYATGTATIALAATAVTGGSTTFTGNVIAGDEFGIGKLLDATRVTGFPTTFYPISVVGGNTSLTLSTAFTETSATAASYICSSVSSITQEEINLASVLYVMGLAYRKDKEHSISESMIASAIARAESCINDIELGSGKSFKTVPYGTIEGGTSFETRNYETPIGLNNYGAY